MATAGSAAERGARPASAAGASRSRPRTGIRSGSSPRDDEAKCAACGGARPGGSPACGHRACPLCLARRHSGSEERLRRRSDTERSGSRPGRRDCDGRRGECVYRGRCGSQSAAGEETDLKRVSNFTEVQFRLREAGGVHGGSKVSGFFMEELDPGLISSSIDRFEQSQIDSCVIDGLLLLDLFRLVLLWEELLLQRYLCLQQYPVIIDINDQLFVLCCYCS